MMTINIDHPVGLFVTIANHNHVGHKVKSWPLAIHILQMVETE